MRKKIVVAAAAALLAGGVYVALPASAAIPAPQAGNITVLPSAPRIAPGNGITPFNAGQTQTFQVANKTFGGITVPANVTGVTLSVTAKAPAGDGKLTVWTTEAGQPGTPSVSYKKAADATSIVFVGLNDKGMFNVASTAKAGVAMALVGYVTPVPAPTATEVRSVAKVDPTVLTGVGGSIRLKSTTFATIGLPAGTWAANVIGGFTGLNNTNKACTPDGTFLTGSMVLVKGDAATFEFADVVATDGGVMIPESNSATLTQDPTVKIGTVFTLAAATKMTVRLFGYASDSSTACEGTLKGNLQGAQFVRL